VSINRKKLKFIYTSDLEGEGRRRRRSCAIRGWKGII